MGNSKVADAAEGCRLLPMANELWNTVFISSRVKAAGSVAGSGDQVTVAIPPEERFVGTLSVRAEMRGTTEVRIARPESILSSTAGKRRTRN